MENRWQPMSALTWCGPNSFSTNFMAAKIGRSGQPVQKPGGRGCTTCCKGLSAITLWALTGVGALATGVGWVNTKPLALGAWTASNKPYFWAKARTPLSTSWTVYSPAGGSKSLPCSTALQPAWRSTVATFCSTKLGWPSSTSKTARLPWQKRNTSASTTG